MVQPEHRLPEHLFINLDRISPVPLYYQIATVLEQAIHDESLPAGARLENEISLGSRLGVSRPTIRRAIQEIVDKGLLVRRRGLGTQVVHGKVTRKVELTSLYEDLINSGQHPRTEIIKFETGVATEETATALGIALGDPIIHIRRLRYADDVPLAILDNVLPHEFANVKVEDLKTRGLYQLLRARGVTMRVAKQRICARKASQAECELLQVPRNSAVLTMIRTAFDTSGRAIEHGTHCYRPDLYAFEMTLVDR